MQNSKLIQIISTLSKTELNKFGEMVVSPYFNKNQDVIRLYEVVYPAFPDFKDEEVDRHVVYPQVVW